MRGSRNSGSIGSLGYKKGYMGNFESSFLSCEEDSKTILIRLFNESKPYSDRLKSLLIINNEDCIDNISKYQETLDDYEIANLISDGYIRLAPKIDFGENEDLKAYIRLTFDNFTPNYSNPYYRDCTVIIDIICHTDCWQMNKYQSRPLKIAGYVDGILNNSKLSGIGTLQFMGCNELIINEDLTGYTLIYTATHGAEDIDYYDKLTGDAADGRFTAS